MTSKKREKPAFDFEQSVATIEALAERLESGELSLEESMNAFEEGVRLTREAQKALAEAEQKVRLLTAGEDGPVVTPLDVETDDGES